MSKFEVGRMHVPLY